MQVIEKELPLYRIHYYNDFVYKVVKFKRSPNPCVRLSDDREEPDGKFSQSYSRAKSMLLQYALCNKWDYFITITVDKEKHDRYDLKATRRYIAQWMLDYRKKYESEIKYVLVPELHKDGAVHYHGFVRGIDSSHLTPFVRGIHPRNLVDAGYVNFGLLARDIGFVSLSPIKNPLGAAFYMSKYITKEMAGSGFYEHLYFASRGLRRARAASDVYAYDPVLESFLQVEGDFCRTGWAISTSFDWTFPFSFDFAEAVVDDYIDFAPMPEEDAEAFTAAFEALYGEQLDLFVDCWIPSSLTGEGCV